MLCWSAAQQQNNVKLFREIKKYHFVDLSRLVIMGSGAGGHIATRVLSEDSGQVTCDDDMITCDDDMMTCDYDMMTCDDDIMT